MVLSVRGHAICLYYALSASVFFLMLALCFSGGRGGGFARTGGARSAHCRPPQIDPDLPEPLALLLLTLCSQSEGIQHKDLIRLRMESSSAADCGSGAALHQTAIRAGARAGFEPEPCSRLSGVVGAWNFAFGPTAEIRKILN